MVPIYSILTFCAIFLQLRYKETFELAKGHYHADKDALDILCAKRVRDDISEVSKRNISVLTF